MRQGAGAIGGKLHATDRRLLEELSSTEIPQIPATAQALLGGRPGVGMGQQQFRCRLA